MAKGHPMSVRTPEREAAYREAQRVTVRERSRRRRTNSVFVAGEIRRTDRRGVEPNPVKLITMKKLALAVRDLKQRS
ncbi:hypothetical protein MRX96_015101 [Rhipicephalus microplus]